MTHCILRTSLLLFTKVRKKKKQPRGRLFSKESIIKQKKRFRGRPLSRWVKGGKARQKCLECGLPCGQGSLPFSVWPQARASGETGAEHPFEKGHLVDQPPSQAHRAATLVKEGGCGKEESTVVLDTSLSREALGWPSAGRRLGVSDRESRPAGGD